MTSNPAGFKKSALPGRTRLTRPARCATRVPPRSNRAHLAGAEDSDMTATINGKTYFVLNTIDAASELPNLHREMGVERIHAVASPRGAERQLQLRNGTWFFGVFGGHLKQVVPTFT